MTMIITECMQVTSVIILKRLPFLPVGVSVTITTSSARDLLVMIVMTATMFAACARCYGFVYGCSSLICSAHRVPKSKELLNLIMQSLNWVVRSRARAVLDTYVCRQYVEPLYCEHFGALEIIEVSSIQRLNDTLKYSGTSLLWTLWEPWKLSLV